MRIALWVAVLISGCSHPFTGVWAGTISQSLSCDDGSTQGFQLSDEEWVIADNNDGLQVATGGDCGVLIAQVSQRTSANVAGKDCKGGTTFGGGSYSESLTSGTLNMDENMTLFGVTLTSALTYRNSNGFKVRGCDNKWAGKFVFKDKPQR